MPTPENLQNYLPGAGIAGSAGFSGAGAGIGAGASAGFGGSAFLQPTVSVNATNSISERIRAKIFFTNCHLLPGGMKYKLLI